MSDRCVIPNYANKNTHSPEQRIPRDGNGYAARFRRVAVARVLPDGNQTMTAIMRMLATVLVLWPAGAFAQAEYLTLKSWTACPTIQNTNEMLVFDGYSADCEFPAARDAPAIIAFFDELYQPAEWLTL